MQSNTNNELENISLEKSHSNSVVTQREEQKPSAKKLNLSPETKRLLLYCVLGLLGFSFFYFASTIMTQNAKVAFGTTMSSVGDSTYNKIYENSYTAAEARTHVTNTVAIHIGTIKETACLEVLEVSDVEYVILGAEDNAEKITSWLEVPGTGVFTVDLTAAEYIIDTERQNVLVRVPKPALTQCTVEYANVMQLNWKNDWFNDSVKVGEDTARNQIKEGELLIEKYMASNLKFNQSAREATKRMIVMLVKQFNPDIPDLKVEVEFIDSI